jgi:flavin-dependent dehydrogenase
MQLRRPIEIVGGGLAGLALGGALRRSGVPVTIWEAGDYPRHRVCGEFIAGLDERVRQLLQLDPVLAGAIESRTVGWYSGGRLRRAHELPSPARCLSRHQLDLRLAEAFVAAGGDLRTGVRIPAIADAPGRVFATGRRRTPGAWLGLKIHAIGLPLQQDLEVHLGDDAYVGLARIEGERVNVCGLFRRRAVGAGGAEVLPAYLRAAGLGGIADRLDAAGVDPASASAIAAVGFDRAVAPAREVRLGDASAVIAPFTGHGMAMAFQGAALAYGPLLAYARGSLEWPAVRADVAGRIRRAFRVRLAGAALLHPFLLRPSHQRWLGWLNQARLLPLRPLYAALH